MKLCVVQVIVQLTINFDSIGRSHISGTTDEANIIETTGIFLRNRATAENRRISHSRTVWPIDQRVNAADTGVTYVFHRCGPQPSLSSVVRTTVAVKKLFTSIIRVGTPKIDIIDHSGTVTVESQRKYSQTGQKRLLGITAKEIWSPSSFPEMSKNCNRL